MAKKQFNPEWVQLIPILCVVDAQKGEAIKLPPLRLPLPETVNANGMVFKFTEFVHNLDTDDRYARFDLHGDVVTSKKKAEPTDHLTKKKSKRRGG